MPAKIFCKVGDLKGVWAEIAEEAVLGRSRSASIRLPTELISGEHARIRYEPQEGCYMLEDLGSTNGTALDGVRVRGSEALGHLHVITLADEYEFIFQDLDRCARRHPEGARSLRPAPSDDTTIDNEPAVLPSAFAGPAADAPGEPVREKTRIDNSPPVLPKVFAETPTDDDEEVVDGTRIQELPVQLPGALARKAEGLASPEPPPTTKLPGPIEEEPRRTITEENLEKLLLGEENGGEGRSDESNTGEGDANAAAPSWILAVAQDEGQVERFVLEAGENLLGRGKDATICIDRADMSRQHARLNVEGGVVTVTDLGSSNHTYVDGTKLERDVPVRLQPGARLKFGGLRARLNRTGPSSGGEK